MPFFELVRVVLAVFYGVALRAGLRAGGLCHAIVRPRLLACPSALLRALGGVLGALVCDLGPAVSTVSFAHQQRRLYLLTRAALAFRDGLPTQQFGADGCLHCPRIAASALSTEWGSPPATRLSVRRRHPQPALRRYNRCAVETQQRPERPQGHTLIVSIMSVY